MAVLSKHVVHSSSSSLNGGAAAASARGASSATTATTTTTRKKRCRRRRYHKNSNSNSNKTTTTTTLTRRACTVSRDRLILPRDRRMTWPELSKYQEETGYHRPEHELFLPHDWFDHDEDVTIMKHFYLPEVKEVRDWSLEQVANLSLQHISVLTPPEIRSLSHDQIGALTPDQASHFTPQQIRHLEVAFLKPEARDALMQCWIDYDADGFLSIYGHLEPCERDYTATYHGGTKWVWVPVWVRVEDPSIERVYCCGDFNNWGVAVPLSPIRQRLFAGEVQMAPGRWKYGFVCEHDEPLIGGFAETLDMGREGYWATDPLTPSFSFPGRGPRKYHNIEIGDPTPRVRVIEEDVSCVVEDASSPVPLTHLTAAKQCLPPDWFNSFWKDHHQRDEGGPRNLIVPTIWNNPERMITRGEMTEWVNQVGDIAEGELYPLIDPNTKEIIDETAEDVDDEIDEDDPNAFNPDRIEQWELEDNPFNFEYRESDGSRIEFCEDAETDAIVAAHVTTAFPEVSSNVLPPVRRQILSTILSACRISHDVEASADDLAALYRDSIINSNEDVDVRSLIPDMVNFIVTRTDALVNINVDEVEAAVDEDEIESIDVAGDDDDDDDDASDEDTSDGDDTIVAKELGLLGDDEDDSSVASSDDDNSDDSESDDSDDDDDLDITASATVDDEEEEEEEEDDVDEDGDDDDVVGDDKGGESIVL